MILSFIPFILIASVINIILSVYLLFHYSKIKKRKSYALFYDPSTNETESKKISGYERLIYHKEKRYIFDKDRYYSIKDVNVRFYLYNVKDIDPIDISNYQGSIISSDVLHGVIKTELIKNFNVPNTLFDGIDKKYLIFGAGALIFLLMIIFGG